MNDNLTYKQLNKIMKNIPKNPFEGFEGIVVDTGKKMADAAKMRMEDLEQCILEHRPFYDIRKAKEDYEIWSKEANKHSEIRLKEALKKCAQSVFRTT